MSIQPLSIFCAILTLGALTPFIQAAEKEIRPEQTQAGALINFARDVHPILAAKCLKCHGPDEAKNDFRVDDSEILLSYVEAGDAEASSLWSDYLVAEDPEMRMPPASVTVEEQMTATELATIKLWIEEGSKWNAVAIEPAATTSIENLSMAARIWKFQGLFHPATTHFPIALLTVSAAFVLLSFMRPDTCEPVAFHCLWIGALGAIVASAAGWSYAAYEGYGEGYSFDLQNSAIDRHRWLGIGVCALSLILIPVALYVRRTEDFGMRFVWLLGSLLLLGGVGTAGYQGGELTYGEGHYEKEFVKYFPDAFGSKTAVEPPKKDKADEVGQDSTDQSSGQKSAADVSQNAPQGSAEAKTVEESPTTSDDAGDQKPPSENNEEDASNLESKKTAEPEDSANKPAASDGSPA